MKKILFFCMGLLMICFYSSVSFGYEVANAFQFPLNDYSKGNNYFSRYGYVFPGEYHLGEDANANAETPVYAIANGIVMKAKIHNGYGGMYVIEHTTPNGDKFCSLYAHMNFATFTKKVGDPVSKNQYLGEVGTRAQNGGWGEHLHFGIRKGAYPDDPDETVCEKWNEYGECIYTFWVLGGYTFRSSVVDDWLDPSEFILNFDFSIPSRYTPQELCGSDSCEINYQTFSSGEKVGWYPQGYCTNATDWFTLERIDGTYKLGYPLTMHDVCICR